MDLLFLGDCYGLDWDRAWTVSLIRRSWLSWDRSWCVNTFSQQSAIGSNVRPKRIWIEVFWSIPFYKGFRNTSHSLRCDLTVLYSCFPQFRCFLRVFCIMVLVTHLTAVLHAGSRLSCHNFLSLCFCFSWQSRPGRLLFRSERASLLVDRLYSEAIEAVKSHVALSASSSEALKPFATCEFLIRSELFLLLRWPRVW